MPDDYPMQGQSNQTPLDPSADLTAPNFDCDLSVDSRRLTTPNALCDMVKVGQDALVTDKELRGETRNEMSPSSASKASTKWGRIWLLQLLVACLLLVATDLLRYQGSTEFELAEEKSQKAREQEEYDRIASQYDDPSDKAVVVSQYYMKKMDAPIAQRAFADQERLERIQRIDQQSRKLDSITPKNAFIREPVGAVLNVAPDILSAVAWLTGNGEAADELRRQSQEFHEARRKLRHNAQAVQQSAALYSFTPNTAPVREPVGGALNTTSDFAAIVEGLTAENEVADRRRLSAKEVYDNAKNSVVFVTVFDSVNTEPIGAGTGFVVSEDGLIATNFHVIAGAQSAKVAFADGRVLTVEGVGGVNLEADLALLKVGEKNHAFLKLGSKELPTVGNPVYALGNPRGRTHTLSQGIVTRESEWTGNSTRIQIDAAISLGSSGGPLLDEYGTVVGVTTAFIRDSQNLNLAVPVELLALLLAERGELQSLADASRTPVRWPETIDVFDSLYLDILGASHLNGDDWKSEVRSVFKRLKSLSETEKQKAGYWAILSHIHMIEDRSQLALDAAETAVKIDAKDRRGWKALDFALQRTLPRNWEMLLAVRQQRIQLEADDAKAEDFSLLGDAFRELERYDEAVDAYHQALVRDLEYSAAYDGLGQVHKQRKQFQDAVWCYKNAIDFASIHFDSCPSYLGLAECYTQMGEFREAIRAYEKALEFWPTGQLEELEKGVREDLQQLRRLASE